MTIAPTNLDEPCGEHFTYRDLVECGETWSHLAPPAGEGIDNAPRVSETFNALRSLCATVLDPAVNRFGRIVLTYGFASPRLTRHIRGRIAPAIDQHASHEVNRAGVPICSRLGAAADFLVPGVDSREVARWIVDSAAFDRLYFYDPDRPLHVSVGPENMRQVVHMRRTASGRRVPRIVAVGSL
ncbi:hypothetical protein [Polyangium aurulentum]|uniref:hypothetical protein n=1 Tax=Polyangium aurulentum TaxID=2567896 RepID=UPI0010AEE586|nr:hypothetical protein [Polyangium aurulentum]UQA61410.1 hypothetical protein E8A73_013420 [Polyangium aurulentum]